MNCVLTILFGDFFSMLCWYYCSPWKLMLLGWFWWFSFMRSWSEFLVFNMDGDG